MVSDWNRGADYVANSTQRPCDQRCTTSAKSSIPGGAKKMSDMPMCLAEWERNLRRCTQEGRAQPDVETKRLALLNMLPTKQRDAIWDVANKLYPTFTDLLHKVQEMVSDDNDSKNSPSPMDVDDLGDDEKGWTPTGQTLVGKGPQGEETLFLLQRRGNSLCGSERKEQGQRS